MRLEVAMTDALDAHADLDALACVDVVRGTVIAAAARDGRAREALDAAAPAAACLCSAPRNSVSPESWARAEEDVRAREAFVVSETAVHAYVRARRDPDRAIVGLARAGASVALLLALVRTIADDGDKEDAS